MNQLLNFSKGTEQPPWLGLGQREQPECHRSESVLLMTWKQLSNETVTTLDTPSQPVCVPPQRKATTSEWLPLVISRDKNQKLQRAERARKGSFGLCWTNAAVPRDNPLTERSSSTRVVATSSLTPEKESRSYCEHQVKKKIKSIQVQRRQKVLKPTRHTPKAANHTWAVAKILKSFCEELDNCKANRRQHFTDQPVQGVHNPHSQTHLSFSDCIVIYFKIWMELSFLPETLHC